MNHPTAAIQTPLDLEVMWQNSLIRVSDQLTIPPVVLRVDEAIIGTLGNFSVSTGKAKPRKLSMSVPLWQLRSSMDKC